MHATWRLVRVTCGALLLGACAVAPPPQQPEGERELTPQAPPPALPDTSGWGVHVLAIARAPNDAFWIGTYGYGIYRWRQGDSAWTHIAATDDSTSLSWGFVNSIAFGADSLTVWYGTVGNGFGLSTDGGGSWRNWTFRQLGPEWQYVVPEGVVTRGDTVYIATADGLRLSWDRGTTWRCVQAAVRVSGGAAPRADGCTERIAALPTKYLLALDVGSDGAIWIGHLSGVSVSRDAGRTWTTVNSEGVAGARVRAIAAEDSATWVATEQHIYVDSSGTGTFRQAEVRVPGYPTLPGAPRALVSSPAGMPPAIATSYGLVARTAGTSYRIYYLGLADRYRPVGDVWAAAWAGPPYWPIAGSGAGLNRVLAGNLPIRETFATPPLSLPAEPRHVWFGRPIAAGEGNPHIDATYRYGSTMGGNFQQHQGVEFNNPAGTAVRAIGDGVVVFAGPGEQNANTVAVRHERQLDGQHVFSTYYHNSSLDVRSGQRVRAGDVIARVGNTGRATNDHLHLEVHVAPSTDSSKIVHPDVRYPPHTVNPQLWIEPLPGTGIVAGRVLDAADQPVAGARIYGLVLPYPEETPFSFAETYQERAHPDPAYGEHFAVGDVPAGEYTLGVRIGDRRVWRRVRVAPGMVTWVEFRP